LAQDRFRVLGVGGVCPVALKDLPEWMQKTYWYFHGPIGHTQPRGVGYMSGSSVFMFLIIEAALAIALWLCILGIKWLCTGDGGWLQKPLIALVCVILGGLMIVRLLSFAGA
jgi:hypothetical protein